MINLGDKTVTNVFFNGVEVLEIYRGDTLIHPDVSSTDSGIDYTEWSYNNPTRTRTATPWTQTIYSNGERGPKVYGTPYTQTETASISHQKGTWEYNITSSQGTRTRTSSIVYTYTDITQTVSQPSDVENGIRSVGTYTYNWTAATRSATVTYTFSDATKTTTLTESGTVTYSCDLGSYPTIPAVGGSVTLPEQLLCGKYWNGGLITSDFGTVTSAVKVSAPSTVSVSGKTITFASRGSTSGGRWTATFNAILSIDGRQFSSDVFTIYQAANDVSYVLTISTSTGDIPASGGSKTFSANYRATYSSGSVTNTSVIPVLTGSASGFTISGVNVSGANRLTTVGARRSISITGSYNGTTSPAVIVYQAANSVVSTASVVRINPLPKLPFTAGTYQLDAGVDSVSTYSSGSTSTSYIGKANVVITSNPGGWTIGENTTTNYINYLANPYATKEQVATIEISYPGATSIVRTISQTQSPAYMSDFNPLSGESFASPIAHTENIPLDITGADPPTVVVNKKSGDRDINGGGYNSYNKTLAVIMNQAPAFGQGVVIVSVVATNQIGSRTYEHTFNLGEPVNNYCRISGDNIVFDYPVASSVTVTTDAETIIFATGEQSKEKSNDTTYLSSISGADNIYNYQTISTRMLSVDPTTESEEFDEIPSEEI